MSSQCMISPQRVEAQEKEEASSGVVIAASKGAKGKGKPRKQKLLTKEETRPSPMGRRVVPRIDPAMRKAAEVERKRVKVRTSGSFRGAILKGMLSFMLVKQC